jgi:hypothetical protein
VVKEEKVPATYSYYYVCDACSEESIHIQTNEDLLKGLPRAWGELRVVDDSPLGDDRIYHFCGDCVILRQPNKNKRKRHGSQD